MYKVHYSKKFKKASQKLKRSGYFPEKEFTIVLKNLEQGVPLEPKYHDHKLSGEFLGYRECHLKPDVLLIYEIIDKQLVLLLINIGSHSDLF